MHQFLSIDYYLFLAVTEMNNIIYHVVILFHWILCQANQIDFSLDLTDTVHYNRSFRYRMNFTLKYEDIKYKNCCHFLSQKKHYFTIPHKFTKIPLCYKGSFTITTMTFKGKIERLVTKERLMNIKLIS